MGDEWDEEALDLKDTELINFIPGQSLSSSYIFSAIEKVDGFISSDMYKFEVGKKCVLRLRPRRWRWMFEEELSEDVWDDRGLAGKYHLRSGRTKSSVGLF